MFWWTCVLFLCLTRCLITLSMEGFIMINLFQCLFLYVVCDTLFYRNSGANPLAVFTTYSLFSSLCHTTIMPDCYQAHEDGTMFVLIISINLIALLFLYKMPHSWLSRWSFYQSSAAICQVLHDYMHCQAHQRGHRLSLSHCIHLFQWERCLYMGSIPKSCKFEHGHICSLKYVFLGLSD